MSIVKMLGAALAATLLASTQATALTITNRDTTSYKVQITAGDRQNEIAIPAGGEVQQPCEPECVISVAGLKGEEAAVADDKFIIYGGKLHKEEE